MGSPRDFDDSQAKHPNMPRRGRLRSPHLPHFVEAPVLTSRLAYPTDWWEHIVHVFIRPTQAFLTCLICSGLLFASREIKMTTTGMTFMDLDWLNRSAEGVVCVRCGFVHTFMAQAHEWVDPSAVKIEDLPVDPLT